MKLRFVFYLLICVLLWSCDQNKGIVEEAAKRFVGAVNMKDKATIYDLYPEANNLTNMSFPDSIQDGELTVEKISESEYVVSINNIRQQRLNYLIKGENNIVLDKTFGVLELDSATKEIAIKTGVPLKEFSDVYLSDFLNEDSAFISYLKNEYSYEINGNLTAESNQYEWNRNFGGSVTVHQPIRNNGSYPISGDEYNIEFNFYSPNGTCASLKKVESGVDLSPGEAYTVTVYPGGAYVKACDNHDFTWITSFVYKNQNPFQKLLTNVKFSGEEYSNYLKWKKEIEEAEAEEAEDE